MAWLSLVIITLIFFTPAIGIAPSVAAQDMIASANLAGISVAIPIPGTGPLHLFLICIATWAVLWLALYLPDRWLASKALQENNLYQNFLSRLGLWNDLVNAFRPPVSHQIAVWLARIVFWGMLIKLMVGYLLQLALDKLLPLLATWLTAQLGGAFFTMLQNAMGQWSKSLSGFGMNTTGVILLVLSILVMIADLAFQTERRYRSNYAIQQHQQELRKNQKDIIISPTQV